MRPSPVKRHVRRSASVLGFDPSACGQSPDACLSRPIGHSITRPFRSGGHRAAVPSSGTGVESRGGAAGPYPGRREGYAHLRIAAAGPTALRWFEGDLLCSATA